ncbi:hypothetical protein F5Y18DRAFT_437234 [Xylariaceae sp. FL1019]|nr:hypothetical protein F5Y18DRAFT_437234 [Xylariaceae sp. FL1019]
MTHAYRSRLWLSTLLCLAASAVVFASHDSSQAAFGRRRLLISTLERDIKRYGSKTIVPRLAPPDPSTLIGMLWRENQDLVDQFLNVEFIKLQAEGGHNATLASYQYYSVQDYYYLVDYSKYEVVRMNTYPEFNPTQLLSLMDSEMNSILVDDVEYSWEFRNETLIKDLGIAPHYIDDRSRSVEELAYANWLQKNADLGWFTMHVASIPCIYGWVQLASKWNVSIATNKNSTFYETWIAPNADPSYGVSLSDFLEANRAEYYSAEANRTWNAVFRQALLFEIAFFNSAIGKTLDDLPASLGY